MAAFAMRNCCLPHLLILSLCALIFGATIPAPLVISPSQYWEGNDGPWSTFTIQIGTPSQNLRVLISTAGSATWVVLPEGCPTGGIADCDNLRGELYRTNASSTYKFNDFYDLVLESNLYYTGTGAFGFDKVGIGWQGDGGPVLDHQVIAGIATEDFWLGSFGLTPRPTNFSDFNDPQPSFVQTLRNMSLIPSLSWSYTAGARYRLNKVFGSLVFGGYDATKAGTKNMTFDLGPDISRDLTVGLQTISMTAGGTTTELLPSGIFTFIDSTVPHIWLPEEACKKFETALGLTWNATVGLYLVNDTLHQLLLSQNASFTFKIGNSTKDPPNIDITLPYAAFDLTVEYPFVTNSTKYFPIVRAVNDTQYTLGRTFLQEAYLTVDYDRSEFHLSQTRFDMGADKLIQAIFSPNSTLNSTKSKTKISGAAIGGITAGTIAALALLASFIFYLRRRRSITKAKDKDQEPPAYISNTTEPFQKAELDAAETMKPGYEIGGTAVEFYQPNKDDLEEMPESSVASPISPDGAVEVQRELIFEMVGDAPVVQELGAERRG